MDNNKQLQDLINGVGAIAELTALIRDNLIRVGFSREEAIKMSESVLVQIFKNAFDKNK